MFPKIINLTLRFLLVEVEKILEQFPKETHQVAFADPELHRELIDHLLRQIPNYYAIVEGTETLPNDPGFIYTSLQEREYLQSLIRYSIADIYREKAESTSSDSSYSINSDNEPSHWFG